MRVAEVIRTAIPGAGDEVVEHVLWGRTPFPFAPLSARDLYLAAYRFRRATDRGLILCDFCDRVAEPGRWECRQCSAALAACRE